jgi:hypothetical protein
MTANLGRSIYPGRMFIAPAGADLADNSAFVDVGWIPDDGLTYPPEDRPVALGFDPAAAGEQPHRRRLIDQLCAEGIAERVDVHNEITRLRGSAGGITVHDEARAFYEERTAPRSAPGADILDTIDAAVQELCACGCRQPLTPDGPSAFYASPECQRRFMEAQTTDPHDVYRRDDAAPYVGVDSAVWPLTETPTEHPETSGDAPDNYRITWSPGLVRLAEAAGNTRIDTSAPRSLEEFLDRAHPRTPWLCPDPSGVGFRRRCEQCAAVVVPSVQDCLTPTLGPEQPRWQQVMVCPTCGRHLPGPAVYADVQYGTPGRSVLTLHLSDGRGRCRRTVHLDRLARLSDPGRAVALLWTDMESELEQFRRRWIGAARVSAMMAAPCVNPANPIRVTNC